ncbi:hypothetical protein [Cyclonatronum proteinivorum]|uniref:hypothetical protein n=1 Tax=Cyclonatronum proteinivorum TaxID=1457365 RepID=UPI000F523F01|nr:hypothetical protein [Cyclonatronum proteinivorum]
MISAFRVILNEISINPPNPINPRAISANKAETRIQYINVQKFSARLPIQKSPISFHITHDV